MNRVLDCNTITQKSKWNRKGPESGSPSNERLLCLGGTPTPYPLVMFKYSLPGGKVGRGMSTVQWRNVLHCWLTQTAGRFTFTQWLWASCSHPLLVTTRINVLTCCNCTWSRQYHIDEQISAHTDASMLLHCKPTWTDGVYVSKK